MTKPNVAPAGGHRNLTRRAFGRTGALAGAAVAAASLSGCAWWQQNAPTIATVTQTVVNDVNSVANAVSGELTALTGILGAGSAKAATVVTLAAQIVSAAGKVVVGMAQSAAQPFVTQIQNAWNSIKAALSGFTLSSAIQDVVTAIGVVLPGVELVLGMVVPAASRVGANAMTLARARQVLAAVR